MKRTLISLTLIALRCSIGLGATIYDNTVTDTGDTIFYSVGPYSEIGDVIQLGGTDRFASTAQVQIFNGGTAGNFDAILRFYALGALPSAPVGAQIGPDFTAINQSAAQLASSELVFNTQGIAVPAQFVFTVSLLNVTGGADIGLNLFDPPAVGSSDNTFLIIRNTSGFIESTVPNQDANVNFLLTATTVPEPSTIVLITVAFFGLLLALRMRNDSPEFSRATTIATQFGSRPEGAFK